MSFDFIDRKFGKSKPVEPETDQYGNPVDGERLIYCCFPDCGCDGTRLCMAENGASSGSMTLNRERRKNHG